LGIALFDLAKQRLSSGLVSGVFNQLGALTIYAEKVDEGGGKLSNVVISDRRGNERQQLFLAKYGQIFSNEVSRTLNLKLFDGTIHEGRGAELNVTYFDSNAVVISESELLEDEGSKEGKKSVEMSMSEISHDIYEMQGKIIENQDSDPKLRAALQKLLVEWHRRYALPFSCLAVGLIGMVLGIQPSRGGKSWGMALNITIGVLVISLYYFALAFSTALGEQGVAAPWFIIWVPNFIFVVLAGFLYTRMENEKWLAVSQAIVDWLERITNRIKKRFAES
jgi:lipopolysaccharide export system permease protein